MRILGIDYGDRRVGLAISDPMGIIASPLTTYERRGEPKDMDYFLSLVREREITGIVVGLPKNMDGSEGNRAEMARAFGEKLREATGIEVIFKDERLSSVSANRLLDEAGMHWSKRKNVVDQIAAQIILQSYLDIKR